MVETPNRWPLVSFKGGSNPWLDRPPEGMKNGGPDHVRWQVKDYYTWADQIQDLGRISIVLMAFGIDALKQIQFIALTK